jgi:SpoIID/LytB domain protein
MSQTGADVLAREGSSYEEILTHYYTGTKLVNLSRLLTAR